MSEPPRADLPAIPYPGIEPFGYAERKVFFARASEARRLIRLIALYRGVLLYAASGVGKSSLVNAGVIPKAIEEGHQPERLRVRARMNEEILVEPIRCDQPGTSFLPSLLTEAGKPAVLSVESFLETVRARAAEAHPLLIFDQFEEWAQLEGKTSCRARILDALVSLINDQQLPVKVLIVLREDYLANLQPLFERCPNLPTHFLRLAAIGGEALPRTIRGPFEDYPGVYEPEIGTGLASEILRQLTDRSEGGDVPLTEVQIVCSTLFKAGLEGEDPARCLATRGGVEGILVRFLEGTLDDLGPELRDPAVALLNRMITSAGTRNVISREELVERVAREEEIPRKRLNEALDGLEKTRLICSVPRREVNLYEIVSEFLVDWIREEADRLRRARMEQAERLRLAAERAKRRWRFIAAGFAAGFLGAVGIAGYAKFSAQKAEAERQKQLGISQLLYEESESRIESSVPQALLLAVESIRRAREAGLDRFPPAEESLRKALASSPGSVLGSYRRPVFDAALSPDGQWLAGTGKGDALYVWRATAEGMVGDPIEVSGYQGRLEAVAVSPDSRWVAVAGDERTVSLWKLAPKDGRPRLLPSDARVRTVLFSSSGRWLVAAGDDDVPQVWSLKPDATGVGQGLSGPECSPTDWNHSPTLRWIAVGCDNGATLVWDLDGKDPTRRDVPGHPDAISTLAFSPDESRLAIASEDGTVSLSRLDPPGPAPLDEELPAMRNGVSDLAFHPSGRWLAIASQDGEILRMVRTDRFSSPVPIPAVRNLQPGLAWSRDGRRLLSHDPNGGYRLWTLSASGELRLEAKSDPSVRTIALSPNGHWLATGSEDGTLLWLDLRQPSSSEVTLRAHDGPIRSLDFGGGDLLLTRSDRGAARLWELAAEDPTRGDEPRVSRDREMHPVPQRSSTSPEGGWRIEVSSDLPVLLDQQSPGEAIPLRLHEGGITEWVFSRDGRWLVTGAQDGSARLWDLDRVRDLVREKLPPDDPVRVVKQPAAVTTAQFSSDGRWLVTLGGTANLWRLGKPLTNRELLGHAGQVTALDISPDSRWLATADDRGKVRLWDISREPPQAVDLPGAEGMAVTRVQFDSKSRRVSAVDRDGKRLEWRTDLAELMDLACRTAGRNLTQQEWSLEGDVYDGKTCPDFPPPETR